MSVEATTDRRRKRIVEHTISGFNSGENAIIFGNTMEQVVADKLGNQKFRQYIARPKSILAITPEWVGPTILKTTFLELKDDAMAQFICAQAKETLKIYNDVHKAKLKITKEVVRGKPQPQYIG